MALTESEVESLRYHLGFGNIGLGASAYSPDGFKELFDDVVSAYLTGSTETTGSTSVVAGTTTAVTVASTTDIVANARLVVDVGDDLEVVTVKSVSGSAFTAKFVKAHTASYPVAVMGGHARVRMLLHQADSAWQSLTDSSVGQTAGLKSVDGGDVEWFQGFEVLSGRLKHYKAIVMSISSLVRVEPAWAGSARHGLLEAY